jgi:hypothetical protein
MKSERVIVSEFIRWYWFDSNVSKELAYLVRKGMGHTRGKPIHRMTQGRIERYHRSMSPADP